MPIVQNFEQFLKDSKRPLLRENRFTITGPCLETSSCTLELNLTSIFLLFGQFPELTFPQVLSQMADNLASNVISSNNITDIKINISHF